MWGFSRGYRGPFPRCFSRACFNNCATTLTPLRIFFCGTPDFAVPSLKSLHSNRGIKIEGVITQPDRPRGRGNEISLSPVAQLATEQNLPVHQPAKIRSDESFSLIESAHLDAIVIIAYGQIIPQRLIDLPRLGWINVHASLLPKYRGAAPIQWALINGETKTGVTTMRIDAGLDTGPILEKSELEIGPDETAPQLRARLAEAGAQLIGGTLTKLAAGAITPQPQDNSQATLAPPLKKEQGRIDWSLPAAQIYNRIRGLDPWPGAYSTFRGKQCQIWGLPAALPDQRPGQSPGGSPDRLTDRALDFPPSAPGTILAAHREIFVACGHSTWLRLTAVQLEGRKRISALEFANGSRLSPSDTFGT
jgi:methionyl-tRNA formyltransferase